MEKIISDYFISKLFAFVEFKKQLRLIIYNKRLQNRSNISLNHYKIFSGKYILYENETKTKGKIFNAYNNMVYYEGELLKGKRNGTGKEYYDYGATIKLKYEGEYLNGKRNGKGKEYDENNGSLMFEGEYLNGERSGKGKELNYDYVIFDGEYLNGKRYKGIIKYYYYHGPIRNITEYENGKIWNLKRYDLDNNIICEIKEGKGFDIIDFNGAKFENEYLEGKIKKIKAYDKNNRLKYEKEFNNDKIWNMKVYDENSNVINEIQNGKGLIKEFDEYLSLEFEGEYLNGERNGKGKEYIIDELKFEGEYSKGKRNGKGKEYNFNDGTLIFEGEYLNGIRNGKGKEYYRNGQLKFEGEYFYDKRIKGKLYIEGKLEFEGEFLFDR